MPTAPDPNPHYRCVVCGKKEYCRKSNGMPRRPDLTLKAMQKWHRKQCPGEPEYMCGIQIHKRLP